jgi:DNA polymerase
MMDAPQHVLHRDFETRSVLDLNQVGAHIYAAHATTEVLWLGYAVDDGPVRLWRPGDPKPQPFIEAATNPIWTASAHNDTFETAIETNILHARYGFPIIPIERHRCTLAASLAVGLPGKLKTVAAALGLKHQKDEAGERLMHQMSKPRRSRKGEDPSKIYWFEDEARMQRLGQYCIKDVECERELDSWLPRLPEFEQRLWLLNNKINDHGFHIDRVLAEAGRRIAEAAVPEIDAELAEVTGGAVTTVNQIMRLKRWLREQT